MSPYTYTGREYEPATGLYQYRERWYDPAVGRFTSEDPLPATNLYAYALKDPVSYLDPTGLFALIDSVNVEVVQGEVTKIVASRGPEQAATRAILGVRTQVQAADRVFVERIIQAKGSTPKMNLGTGPIASTGSGPIKIVAALGSTDGQHHGLLERRKGAPRRP